MKYLNISQNSIIKLIDIMDNLNIVILGDIGVGKSSFINSIYNISNNTVYIYNYMVKFYILDKYDTELINKANGIIIMFDITNKTSFDNIKKYIFLCENKIRIVIANKNDLPHVLYKNNYFKKIDVKYKITNKNNIINNNTLITKFVEHILNANSLDYISKEKSLKYNKKYRSNKHNNIWCFLCNMFCDR